MSASISREDAITILCDVDLKNLTLNERTEQLEIMMLEDWESNPNWTSIATDVRSEIENGHEIKQPFDRRYDSVLTLWLQGQYCGARNEFLLRLLREHGYNYQQVVGNPIRLVPCPCCGCCTLGHRGRYEICRVCWWEDDGQDNDNVNRIMGGPNYHLSLTRGRINYLTSGISDPSRDDLRKQQEPPDKYMRGRTFILSDDGCSVSEPSANWHASIDDEAP